MQDVNIQSICAITAARIKSVLEIDPLDFTYTIVADTIFGGLEIELGIINACLPLLRPLLRKLTSSSTGLTTYNTNPGRSDGFNSSQTKSSTIASSKNFSRLRENVYPLHDMETSIHGGADLERLCDYERPGDVLVQKDVYVYSTATGPSNQY